MYRKFIRQVIGKSLSLIILISLAFTWIRATALASPPYPAEGNQMLFLPMIRSGLLPAPAVSTLRPRATFPKPAETLVDNEHFSARQVVLKFQEGTHIRLRNGQFVFDPSILSDEEKGRLARLGLTPDQVKADVDQINARLMKETGLTPTRLFFNREEAQLAQDKAAGEKASQEELADLDLYSYLTLDQPDILRATDLVNWLNKLATVEIAYPQPIPFDAAADIPPTTVITPPLTQAYLGPAPSGIDSTFAKTFPGGTGAGVRIVDVEVGWYLDHEDLPSSYFFQFGFNLGLFAQGSHGTAVLGEMGAVMNGFGVTGIVPDASFGVSSPINGALPLPFYNMPTAILIAGAVIAPGDIVLIEQHYPGPRSGLVCTCNCTQFEFVPVEYFPAEFDAIRFTTARNVIVVEAAGNGSMDLDSNQYGGRFDRTIRDSRAIMVGGGIPLSRMPDCWTNNGSRLDVQGWGDFIETLSGNSEIKIAGGDLRQMYTRTFGGTSGASPIVVGAAAAIQGARIASGHVRLDPVQMRDLLVSTGTPQGSSITKIGPLPDLHKALDTFMGVSNVTVRRSSGSEFRPNEAWTDGPYFGSRGTFFADVNGDRRADAIVVNDDTVTVRRSNGNGFDAKGDWTHGAFFGDLGTYFADVDGDGKADAIAVNNDSVYVRRSNGSGFNGNQDWTHGAYFGDNGIYFADVTGDGRADAIVVNNNTVIVRRSNGNGFDPNQDWTHGAYLGDRGIYFADVTGDGKADAIVVNNDTVVVRRSNGSGFDPNQDWTHGPYFGNIGAYFADVDGDGRADAIAVNR